MSAKTGSAKGFAFLQFEDSEHAVTAFQENDGKTFQGRLLHIIPASSKRDPALDEFAISKLPLKKQKEIRRKADATRAAFNWNSLYLNVCYPLSITWAELTLNRPTL